MQETQREKIQREALSNALQHNRCGLAISMGVGKTYIGLQHIEANYSVRLKVLVVAPKVSIFESWKQDAVKFKLEHLLDHMHFTTYLSLNKHNPEDYDIIYLDECHSLLITHEPFLANYDGKILGLTGTPPFKGEKALMVGRYCPIVYRYTVDEATDSNILNDYRIIVHHLELNSKIADVSIKTKSGGSFNRTEVDTYRYWTNRLNASHSPKDRQITSVMRMRALMDFKTKERYSKHLLDVLKTSGDKCIVFANTQAQADRISPHSYHSGNSDSEDNLDMFKNNKIQELSCVLQLNEGVNIPDLKQGIIMHAYGNERKSAQRLGRLLRLNPDEVSYVHILCYDNTIDTTWLNRSLDGFDDNKIFHLHPDKDTVKQVLTNAGYYG
jgi:superfamily II DNA or RNA helicase